MLNAIHILLTYACTYECDHCFLYGSPKAKGTFTLPQLQQVFTQIDKIPSIKWVYFEGGEPFLYYPLMLEGLRLARQRQLKTGVVSNAYWANSEKDAKLWLKPLWRLNVADLSISDDEFHSEGEDRPAAFAVSVARKLGLPVDTICIEKPTILTDPEKVQVKGAPVIGSGALFKGRAAEKLTIGLPTRPLSEFKSCPHEDLENPGRVHIDAFGHVHLCQGISLGNLWETPLSKLIADYQPSAHPICGPLIAGGPRRLAQTYGVHLDSSFVDECHYCYSVRRILLDRFPQYLAPRQVYGLE